jgi:putative Mn2+ efflux pump MntP
VILVQAFATSIDALVVGITLNEYTIPFYLSVIIIALVTFGLVSLALLLGKKLGKVLGEYSNYVAIFIILFLAIKNLF